MAKWQEAQRRRGALVPNAGQPDIRPIPGSYDGHLGYVCRNKQFKETFPWARTVHFKLVEIAPLLAFQFHVSLGHRVAPSPKTLREQLVLCLPTATPDIRPRVGSDQHGGYVEADDLNFAIFPKVEDALILNRRALLLAYGLRAPWVQVSGAGGRFVLLNGYHRAYQLLSAGIEYIPCLLIEKPDFRDVPIVREKTFEEPLLLSQDPPTCRHLQVDRAYEVQLRRIVRRYRIQLVTEDLRE